MTGWEPVAEWAGSATLDAGEDEVALRPHVAAPPAWPLAVVLVGGARRLRWAAATETAEREIMMGHGDVAVFAEQWAAAGPAFARLAGTHAASLVHWVPLRRKATT